MAYDKDKDYMAEMNKAAVAGDTAAAAAAERARNEKIDGEGLSAAKTYVYHDEPSNKVTVSTQKASSGGASKSKNYGSYRSDYSSQIADMMNKVLNRDKFEYNPETDETYKQYEKSYTKAGQRAMRDTAGEIASRTGGIASSYAASAASQAYDNYMSALADKIPALKQAAYEMYKDEYERDLAKLGILQNADSDAYQRYIADRNFNYQLDRDKVADSQADRAFKQNEYQFDANRQDTNNQFQQNIDFNRFWNTMNYGQNAEKLRYQMERDKVSDEQFNRQMAVQEAQQQFANALALWQELGFTTQEISSMLGAYGIPTGQKTATQDYQDWYRNMYK